MAGRPAHLEQLPLPIPNTWGGKRKGAGRKRVPNRRSSVPHRTRPVHRAAHPVHVTLRARTGLPPLRDRAIFTQMKAAIREASRSPAVGSSFRVVQFSVQNDHLHLIVEASDADHLGRGVQGLAIRLARVINRVLVGSGKVWGERYHARPLRTPREVRNAIVYVLMNAKKHLRRASRDGVDPMSSAPWFDGFRGAGGRALAAVIDAPVVASRTWLGATGWRRHGLVRVDDAPA